MPENVASWFWACTLMLGGLAPAAEAEDLVFRFEAELRHVHIQPPEDSVTAQAANASSITGTFGFSTEAPVSSEAGIPSRVEFAEYDTGFISINEVDVSVLPGSVGLRIGNWIAQSGDPQSAINDDLIISFQAVSLDEPIDSASLRFRYRNATMLQSVAIPTSLDYDDFESVDLTFSHRVDSVNNRTRIDSGSNRGDQISQRNQILGLVLFDVTFIERVE